VIVRHHPTVFQIRNIVSRVYDKRCPNFPRMYRRGGGLGSASPFCRQPAFANEHIVVLSEDVEHERARMFAAVYGLSSPVVILRT
jgi:hypothetical protein